MIDFPYHFNAFPSRFTQPQRAQRAQSRSRTASLFVTPHLQRLIISSDSPKVILGRLKKLEAEIASELEELETMLG